MRRDIRAGRRRRDPWVAASLASWLKGAGTDRRATRSRRRLGSAVEAREAQWLRREGCAYERGSEERADPADRRPVLGAASSFRGRGLEVLGQKSATSGLDGCRGMFGRVVARVGADQLTRLGVDKTMPTREWRRTARGHAWVSSRSSCASGPTGGGRGPRRTARDTEPVIEYRHPRGAKVRPPSGISVDLGQRAQCIR